MVILNLESGAVFDVGRVLDLHAPGRQIGYFDVRWAPDGTQLSLEVWNSLTPPPSEIESDLFSIDAARSTIRYVASRPPTRQAGAWHEWQPAGSGYVLRLMGEHTTYRKRPDQLPARVAFD
jgi:hypothetical protein